MTVTFVPVAQVELDNLLAFVRDYYREDNDQPFDAPVLRNALNMLLSSEQYGRVWFIVADGVRVGYLVVAFGFAVVYGGRDATLDELYIVPAYRGRGIGSQAVDFAIAYARGSGVGYLHLEVYDDNPAHTLYERAGFERHASRFMTLRLD
jgi:GNAT superfamily N-acetyltransferase